MDIRILKKMRSPIEKALRNNAFHRYDFMISLNIAI